MNTLGALKKKKSIKKIYTRKPVLQNKGLNKDISRCQLRTVALELLGVLAEASDPNSNQRNHALDHPSHKGSPCTEYFKHTSL